MELIIEKIKRDLMKGRDDDDKWKGAIHIIFNSARERIFKVADKMVRGQLESKDEVEVVKDPEPILLPGEEEWDFELGDTVRVKLSRDDFKWIQKKTLGWRTDLNQVIGQVGFVTNVYCKYENSITVYFPEIYTGTSLYAGVLEKCEPSKDPTLTQRWKRGTYVKTISDPKILSMLQRGLQKIPEDLIGKRGKVVAVSHACVIVTFDNKSTYDLKSRSLVPCDEDEKMEIEEIDHQRGFKVGDQVRIISHMEMLIDNQKNYGGWNADMSPILGQLGTIINIQIDGSLNVQLKHSRAWRLNPNSVHKPNEKIENYEKDLKFLPGTIVKVALPRNIRRVLADAQIPLVFLEYLRNPAILALVDDDKDYFIKFNSEQNIQTHTKIIRLATDSEKERYSRIQRLVEGVKTGDRVHLDIGPPNFVQSVISELRLPPKLKMALTSSSILEGFVNAYTAVIRYGDGSLFRVQTKFLTVPEKFDIEQGKTVLPFETISNVQKVLSRAVQDIHSRDGGETQDWKVTLSQMREGNPSYVEYRITSMIATEFKPISQWLEDNTAWEIDHVYEGQMIVQKMDDANTSLAIKIGIMFNDDISEYGGTESSEICSTAETVVEECQQRNIAVPIRENNSPNLHSFDQLSFLKFSDPAIPKDVWFPYIIDESRPARPGPDPEEPPPPRGQYDLLYDYSRNDSRPNRRAF